MWPTFRLCDKSCGTKIPLLNTGCIEYVNSLALQSYDFSAQHKPGKLHVVPDTLSQTFAFEHQQEVAEPSLSPIGRNVSGNPELHTALPTRPYQISVDNLDNL